MPFPLDEKYVLAAEKQIDARMLDAYRSMMMAENRGCAKLGRDPWWLHPIIDTSDKKLSKRTCNHVVVEIKTRHSCGGFPENAVEIASSSYGDAIVFPHEGGACGPEVHVFDHETHAVRKTKWAARDLAEKGESQ